MLCGVITTNGITSTDSLFILRIAGNVPYNTTIVSPRVNEGQTTTVTCETSGWPVPNITLDIENGTILEYMPNTVDGYTTRTSVNVNFTSALIICNVTNEEGSYSIYDSVIVFCEL